MKTIFGLAIMSLSASAFAVSGYECTDIYSDKTISVQFIDGENAKVTEAGKTEVVPYDRSVYAQEPLMAFSSVYLTDGRKLDLIESSDSAQGVILLPNYNLEVFGCEAIK